MSKTIKNSFHKKLTFESLIQAHYRACRNKTNRFEVLKFNIDLETNLCSIYNELKSGTYQLSQYKEFVIYEPKERIIKCLPYRDRIVHQWYIHEFIKPYIIPRLINTTCACIDSRGTHYAVKITQKYMRIMKRTYHNYYILKLDIKKYFYNIDKDILYQIMSEYISDKLLLQLTHKFIYDNNEQKGIPIGNYTSQYFANIYLDKLDKYIKQDLKVKYYIRYMDDLIILVKDKKTCRNLKEQINLFLNEKLNLELNTKSRYYPSILGVNFCGYRIYETHILVRNRSKKEMRKRINKWNKLFLVDKLDIKRVILSLNSWLGHVRHANSYNLVSKYLNRIKLELLEKVQN